MIGSSLKQDRALSRLWVFALGVSCHSSVFGWKVGRTEDQDSEKPQGPLYRWLRQTYRENKGVVLHQMSLPLMTQVKVCRLHWVVS